MQHQEIATIQRCSGREGNLFGRIKLENIADPKSVKVFLCGKRLYPKEFNILGEPIFTREVCDLFEWKEKSLKRIYGKKYRLMAIVLYDEANLDLNLHEIDSLDGIKSRLKSIKTLNDLLKDRKICNELSRGGKLNEYVIFGKYRLDKFGQVWTLSQDDEISGVPIVCTQRKFDEIYQKVNSKKVYCWEGTCDIPSKGDSCPWCTKKFTISDVKNERFNTINGKIAHNQCAKQYEHEKQINNLINELIELIYEEGVTFEIIPNGYCNQPCCAHKPWFLCHTPDGDIEIGWRKRVISIEWKQNFKPFDMSIFKSEDVTKWERGIHAWGTEKAYEYIKKVSEIVNAKP